jgi:hypothetical protein
MVSLGDVVFGVGKPGETVRSRRSVQVVTFGILCRSVPIWLRTEILWVWLGSGPFLLYWLLSPGAPTAQNASVFGFTWLSPFYFPPWSLFVPLWLFGWGAYLSMWSDRWIATAAGLRWQNQCASDEELGIERSLERSDVVRDVDALDRDEHGCVPRVLRPWPSFWLVLTVTTLAVCADVVLPLSQPARIALGVSWVVLCLGVEAAHVWYRRQRVARVRREALGVWDEQAEELPVDPDALVPRTVKVGERVVS